MASHCLSLVDPEAAVSGHGEPVSYLDAFKFGLWNLWIFTEKFSWYDSQFSKGSTEEFSYFVFGITTKMYCWQCV